MPEKSVNLKSNHLLVRVMAMHLNCTKYKVG